MAEGDKPRRTGRTRKPSKPAATEQAGVEATKKATAKSANGASAATESAKATPNGRAAPAEPKPEAKPAAAEKPAAEQKPKSAAKAKAEAEAKSLAEALAEAFTEGGSGPGPEGLADLARNMTRVFERARNVWATTLETQAMEQSALHLDPFNTFGAFGEFWQSIMHQPAAVAETTLKFWTDQAELWRRATMKAMGAEVEPVATPSPGDKRFKDPEWSQNVVFDVLKQSYLLTAAYLNDTAHNAGDLEDRDRRKVEFFTRQFVDALSPSNFFATNPEVLRATLTEKGENLMRGLDNVLADMERGRGQLMIRQTDLDKFRVGENMAVTEGEVIFRNDVIELIQYAPSTATVQKRPLLICPPWINKFYILDLNPKKSMVRWLVDQGHTVFMMSWVNPGPKLGEKLFVDYIAEGLFEAVAHVLDETGAEDLHVASYCVGGTMAGAALTYLSQRPEHPLHGRIASATFFTAQFEFSNAGDLQIFVDDEQLQLLEQDMASGVLPAEKMAQSFNMLRSADLIWSFVVNNYLLGKDPFPFDLLYWNSDSTRMPARTHKFYLEKFYRDNAMAKGQLRLGDVTLDLSKVETPTYHVATREDHIAPAASVYRGVRLTGGERRFVLAGSGHIAGVVNPPEAGKYQHWLREDGAWPGSVEDWLAGAKENPGSWWEDWDGWLKRLNGGETVPARKPGRRHKPLCKAPGTYVRVRGDEADGAKKDGAKSAEAKDADPGKAAQKKPAE